MMVEIWRERLCQSTVLRIANWLLRLARTALSVLEIQLRLPDQNKESSCERFALSSQDAVLMVHCQRFNSSSLA